MINYGEPVPSFKLKGIHKGEEKVFEFQPGRTRGLLLWFYYQNHDETAHQELEELERHHHEFEAQGIEVWAVSKSSLINHKNWLAEMGGLSYPLLSDADGLLSEIFGCNLKSDPGLAAGTFLLSPEGKLLLSYMSGPKILRNAADILRVAEKSIIK